MGLYKLLLSSPINILCRVRLLNNTRVTVYVLQIIVSLFSAVKTRVKYSSSISFRFLLFSTLSFGGKVVIEEPPVDTHCAAREL